MQKQCCICLEELTGINSKNVFRLDCGHHFHRHCIETHVEHSKKMNGTEFATCPLCRKKIENAELISEPSLVVYKHIPDDNIRKSKSFDETLISNTSNKNNAAVQRASTEVRLT
eukprot:UN09104